MTLTYPPGNGVSAQPAYGSRPTSAAAPVETTTFWPAPPETLEETGLILPLVEDHLVRLLYFSQQATGSELAGQCGIPYVAIQPIVRSEAKEA